MAFEGTDAPPNYCEYVRGACDQSFAEPTHSRALFLYSSDPPQIASTIETAVQRLQARRPGDRWITWRDLPITGQIVFCEICKGTRFAATIVADVTTLNFNLMFEIGFAIGLGVPIIPIRDTSFVRDRKAFDELGLLDTIGYRDFQNADQLSDKIMTITPAAPSAVAAAINRQAPLYVVKGPLHTEGDLRLLSAIKKSALRFRTFDVVETPRLSLHEIRRQVGSSLGVVVHLLSQDRAVAAVHNARCAIVAGLAMAQGKCVLMLQEGLQIQPIDYRDLVVSYKNVNDVPRRAESLIRNVIDVLQRAEIQTTAPPQNFLQRIDIGDVAAENEIRALQRYFVETAQYQQAKRGYARLVVGRKGTGKTAIFYAVRDSFSRSGSRVVLDLKPEGHQFTRLRETVLSRLTAGLQEHTMTAFWSAILLAELAHKITEEDYTWAHRDSNRAARFDDVKSVYEECGFASPGDFSERLLHHVERLRQRADNGREPSRGAATEVLYREDIRRLEGAVATYLAEKEEVWLLVDNLDKGLPTAGATAEDILILRTLLEATRKLQRELERDNVDFHCLVFLRNDIYEHLLKAPDKGKDTAIVLDWSDAEVFKELFSRRVESTRLVSGKGFEKAWNAVMSPYVGTENSFAYILDRTLLRPRDFLSFVHRAIEVAINRGHSRVEEEDILQAEKFHSNDLLQGTAFELQDVYPNLDVLYEFLGCPARMTEEDIRERLARANVVESERDKVIQLLVWFGFLGVEDFVADEKRFSHNVRYDIPRLLMPIKRGEGAFVVHHAYHAALECEAAQ